MRPTCITGWVTSDPTDPQAERHLATIRWDEATSSYVALTNPKDVDLGDPRQLSWATIASVRHGLQAAIRRDGRRSASGRSTSQFTGVMADLTYMTHKGKQAGTRHAAGRWQPFAAYCAYVATWSDKDYRGETKADRVSEVALILAQESWE